MFWFETAHPGTGERLEVAAVYCPPCPGARDGCGAPLEPDDTESVYVCEVRGEKGQVVDFSRLRAILEVRAWGIATEAEP